MVAYLQVRIEGIPRVRCQLFQTESNTFFLVVEIEDNHIDFLVELNHFRRIVYTSPTQVGDVNQTIYAAKVDKCTERGNVFDNAFEHLTSLEFRDNLFFLFLEFGFDKCFVRNDNVFVFLVDFNDFELHRFAYEYVVVADGFNVDLRTRQEGFDAEYIDNHAAFGATFYIAFDNLFVVEGFVYTIPRTRSTGCFVRQNQLTFFVFLALDVHFYLVADFQVGVVAKLAHRNDTVRFETDVYHYFAFVHRDDGAHYDFFVFHFVQCVVVLCGKFCFFFFGYNIAIFVGIPIEVSGRGCLKFVFFHCGKIFFLRRRFWRPTG